MPSPQQAGLAGHHARGQHPGGRAGAVKLDRTEVGAAVAVLCALAEQRVLRASRQAADAGVYTLPTEPFKWSSRTHEQSRLQVRLVQTVTLQPTAGLWLT